MHECLSWCLRDRLTLCWSAQLLQSHVLPAALFGMELMPTCATLNRFESRLLQWGRRLLRWPAGTPRAAVIAELGWLRPGDLITERAAGLFARLASIAPHQCRRQMLWTIFNYARHRQGTWAHDTSTHFTPLMQPEEYVFWIPNAHSDIQ